MPAILIDAGQDQFAVGLMMSPSSDGMNWGVSDCDNRFRKGHRRAQCSCTRSSTARGRGLVQEHRAGFKLVANMFGAFNIAGPRRSRQTRLAVIHRPDRLFVVRNRHDPHNWAKALIPHHPHVMGHIGQDLRRQASTAIILGKGQPSLATLRQAKALGRRTG